MFDSRTTPYAALLLRLALGIMFLAHGLTKLLVFTPAGTAKFFDSIGFTGWLAYPVMAFEIVAGILLIVGVYTAGSRHWLPSSSSSPRAFISATGGRSRTRTAAGNIRYS